MISYVKGELTETGTDSVVVEAGGIGYQIFVPSSILSELPPIGETVKIYTYFQVREDAMQLFGFLHRDDLEVFRMLIGVSGIGPKGALAILSGITPDDLRFAVISGDDKAIAKAPGIGRKTAQKVILELKDRMSLEDAFEKKSEHIAAASENAGAAGEAGEAVEALTALGYSATDALRAVRAVAGAEQMDVESLLKAALARMASF